MKNPLFRVLLNGPGAPRGRGGRDTGALIASAVATAAIFSFGCGSQQTSNYSNVNVVYQTNVENTNAKAKNMNTMANSNTVPVQPVTSDELATALKARLKAAKQNALKPDEWDQDIWLKHPLGLFLKDNDVHSRDAVCNAMDDVLGPRNEQMTGPSRTALRKAVDHSTACKKAVRAMLDASVKVVPIVTTP